MDRHKSLIRAARRLPITCEHGGKPCSHLLITCEHGGNKIPPQYRALFRPHVEALHSHRGYDPGALALARDLSRAFDAELVYSTTSRLLVELNRSPRHPQVWSEASRGLPAAERERVMAQYYRPYREWVESQVHNAVAAGTPVLHISSHSFTPRLHGVTRRADVGLLYDPRRPSERELCLAWQRAIRDADPRLVVRRNYPYRGNGDGLTTHLRRLHPDASYQGIEIEVNQKYVLTDRNAFGTLRALLVETLGTVLGSACRGLHAGDRADRQ